jgi:uncharacterized protein YbjQ (UPF0145 family)
MSEWDGQGLPPVAKARIRRASETHARTSLLSTGGATALAGIGISPIGEVMGCVVEHIGFAGFGCGWYGGGRFLSVPTGYMGGTGSEGYAPYRDAIYYGYEQALRRLLLEAQALQADGVVDIRWTQQRLDDVGNREFVAIGTAVRADSASRPAHLFSTDLSGQDVAKLLHAGWAPSGLTLGLAVSVRHDDYYTRSQASSWSFANQEVAGYTELVTHVRDSARQAFSDRAARQGGDTAIVSHMGMQVWGVEPSDGHRDHVAEASVIGTAVVRFDTHARPDPTTTPVAMLRVNADRRQR